MLNNKNTSKKDKNIVNSSSLKKKIKYQDIISIDNLTKGLARTKNNVSPGLDGEIKSNFTTKKN